MHAYKAALAVVEVHRLPHEVHVAVAVHVHGRATEGVALHGCRAEPEPEVALAVVHCSIPEGARGSETLHLRYPAKTPKKLVRFE